MATLLDRYLEQHVRPHNGSTSACARVPHHAQGERLAADCDDDLLWRVVVFVVCYWQMVISISF